MKYAAVLLSLAAALPAAADEVHLRNGSKIEGRVSQAGDEVVVVMDIGTVTFKRSEVSRVVLGPSTLQAFEEKVRQLQAADVDGRFKLAMWAKQNELANRAQALFKDVLALDAEHAGARGELGYVKHDGRWLTQDEHRAAQGLVNFRGAWIKQTEAEATLQREADRATDAAREAEVARAQVRLLESEAEYNRARAEVERIRAKAEEEEKRRERERPSWYAPVVIYHVHNVGGRMIRCCCNNRR